MPIVHFLNVKQGDCSIIQHYSGHISVMDVCNAKPVEELDQLRFEAASKGILGNFNQKQHPVNPISYMSDREMSAVFRFILSHPDMDHMDGIKASFDKFNPVNFWDTNNKEKKEFGSNSPYNEED